MMDKKELRKELIRNNPNDSTTDLIEKAKTLKISNRRTDFLAEVRNIRKIPEPSKAKKERSVPIKYQKVKVAKPKAKIPFEQTKFGRIVKNLQTKHNISEKRAIIHARRILKIPRTDYDILNELDYDILIHYGY